MNIETWLKKSTDLLTAVSISTARLDSLVLLEDATGKDRGWLLANPEFNLTRSDLVRLEEWVKRRTGHEPLAYIRGRSEFYGREFLVTPDTLQPRSETETMIDLLKNLLGNKQSIPKTRSWEKSYMHEDGPRAFVDVGTGSGCLAITAKLEWPSVDVYATEINDAALKIAKQNAVKLKADVKFYKGNLLQPFSLTFFSLPFIILANLPYVPDSHTINQSAMQEPRVAIFGGEDGLDLYRKMFNQIQKFSVLSPQSSGKPKYILTESLPFQHKELTVIARKQGFQQIAAVDFIQAFCLTT